MELDGLLADYLRGVEGASQVLHDALHERGLPPPTERAEPDARLEAVLELLSFSRLTELARQAALLALSRLPAANLVREAKEVLDRDGPIPPELRRVPFSIWRILDRQLGADPQTRIAWATWMFARGQPLIALRTLRTIDATELKAQIALVAGALVSSKTSASAIAEPTEEDRFWSLIEDAWAPQGDEVHAARLALASRSPGQPPETSEIDRSLERMIETLRNALSFDDFPQAELVAMDRVIERKLYEIDREDVHEFTDGSDDGFLYARGYIVAMGKAFFEAVNKKPEMAVMGAYCEELCYLAAHVHDERFDEFPDTGASISRETASNPDGWSDD